MYVMQGATFLGPDAHWAEDWTPPAVIVQAAPRPRPFTASPSEEADRRHRAEVALADRYASAAHQAGTRWARDNPDAFAPIKDMVERSYRGVPALFAKDGIKAELTQRCAREAGFPSFDDWCSQQSSHAGAA